jgi:DNA-binding response OmpR family regulator
LGARFELAWPCANFAHDASDAFEVPDSDTIRPQNDLSCPRVPSNLALDGSRILVVEDDSAVSDLLDTALSARGAEVLSIRHRSQLHAALSTGTFDAALFDISPIADDILGALRDARATSEDLRVVLISGSSGMLPELPTGWVTAWVRKPFEVTEVVAVLTTAGRRLANAGKH